MTIKEQNAKELQRAWKKFMRMQNEKEKTEKENQKAEEKGELVSSQNGQQHSIKHNEGENKCIKTFGLKTMYQNCISMVG